MSIPDAVVVGAGPNGLSAAIELARNGLDVLVVEANDTVGGAARTEALTLRGYLHDVGSAVYPLGAGSPFLGSLPLGQYGLEWLHATPLAHVLDGGRAAVLERDLGATATALGPDGPRYRRLFEPLVRKWPALVDLALASPIGIPRDPLLAARFGLQALRPATDVAAGFRTEEARALFAGNAAHSGLPLDRALSAGIGLVLMAAGHAIGWPIPRGGAGVITGTLAAHLRTLGGRIEVGAAVRRLEEVPRARATLLALTFRQVARVAGGRLPPGYRRRLEAWVYGPGAFKVDWALDDPIPWEAEAARRATTVHVCGTYEEVVEAERAPAEGRVADRPFVLLAQPTVVDPTRAPPGRHIAWAYCHVPNGWRGDATARIEAQIERFAPGFRERILARAVHAPKDLETWDANLVGGDVNGGAPSLWQTFGPMRWTSDPWGTPVPDLYVCSASTPPGGGVHGMAGYWAARSALRRTFGTRLPS